MGTQRETKGLTPLRLLARLISNHHFLDFNVVKISILAMQMDLTSLFQMKFQAELLMGISKISLTIRTFNN